MDSSRIAMKAGLGPFHLFLSLSFVPLTLFPYSISSVHLSTLPSSAALWPLRSPQQSLYTDKVIECCKALLLWKLQPNEQCRGGYEIKGNACHKPSCSLLCSQVSDDHLLGRIYRIHLENKIKFGNWFF